MAHTCHAEGCETPVTPSKLMCWKHWCMVPQTLQQAVTDRYRSGQEKDKQPSRLWLEAARAAINAVKAAGKESER